jgi:hypothetical protein
MTFDLDFYYLALQQELWLIPILILVILLQLIKNETKTRKIIVVISICFLLFIAHNIYAIFSPLFQFPDHIEYLIKYPYGFIFLFLFFLLIVSIFNKNSFIKIISISVLLIVCFNQVYLRLMVSDLMKEYKMIENGRETEAKIFTGTDTTEVYPISNSFGFENDYRQLKQIQKNVSFTPYFNFTEETFFWFKFPNYYWTRYNDFFRENISLEIENNFVPPSIIERVSLKSKNKIKEFFLVMNLNDKGELKNYSLFPNSVELVNLDEYLNSIKITPAYFDNKPVEVSYTKKYSN